MNTYYMKHVIPWRYVVVFCTLMAVAGGIGYLLKQKLLIPNSDVVIPGVMIGLFWLGHYLAAHRVSISDIAITIDDAGIRQIWLNQPMFSNKPDTSVRWEDMAEYLCETGGRTYWVFSIRLRDGTTWRLCRYLTWKKDDFERFRADFSARVEQFNEVNKVNSIMILEGKTSWERTPALVVAVLLVIAMVALPFVMMVRPDMIRFGALAIGYPGALLLVIAIYYQRKRRREYERRLSQEVPGCFQEK